MCRLFGFRSVIKSQVHSSLVEADNALLHQSNQHPDGWGVAYYLENAPHVIKSVQSAVSDHLFQKVSGLVASETVLAHLRKATLGDMSITNTHPFQYGRWVFAHNGNIKGFDQHRPALLALVDEDLAPYILGESDTELIFFILLTQMRQKFELREEMLHINVVADAVRAAMNQIIEIIGPFSETEEGPTETYLTFILTNGHIMLGFHGGKPLLYSTYKTKCPDRGFCPSFSESCEAETKDGLVNHLVLSSESLEGSNVFLPLSPGELVGVDHRMRLFLYNL